jgi:hypothetical protein
VRVDDYTAGSGQLTVADLQNKKTDEANYNSRPLEPILTEFRSAREVAETRGRVRSLALLASASPSAFEDTDAPGRPFVFRRGAQRSPPSANLGAFDLSPPDGWSQAVTVIRGLVCGKTSPICMAGTPWALRAAATSLPWAFTDINNPPAVWGSNIKAFTSSGMPGS